MKAKWGLLILLLVFVFVGCSKVEEPKSEKEKFVKYLVSVDYECNEIYCEKKTEDLLYLPSENYIVLEWSYINLKDGFIRESVSYTEDKVWDTYNSISKITWVVEYTLVNSDYQIDYEYLSLFNNKINKIAYGTIRNDSYTYRKFPQSYYDENPKLEPLQLQAVGNHKYNNLLNKWENFFKLSEINKDKLIEKFEKQVNNEN